jgi:hypothetical protein
MNGLFLIIRIPDLCSFSAFSSLTIFLLMRLTAIKAIEKALADDINKI